MNGIKIEYGSISEKIAITAYARQRTIEYLTAVLGVVVPDSKPEVAKQLKSLFFPEEKYDQLAYIKKAQETFKKLRKFNLKVTPGIVNN